MSFSPRWRKSWYPVIILFFIPLILLPGYMAWEAGNPTITPLHIRGAPDGIVFIADPHIKNENKETVREVIRMINEMQPSIVLIGGILPARVKKRSRSRRSGKVLMLLSMRCSETMTIRSGSRDQGAEGRMAWVIESILRSQGYNTSPLYSDPDIASADILEDVLERNGVTVLRNEWISLDMNGQRLILCGLDDIWAGKADPPDLPDNGAYRIYLLHEPYYQEEWDADLILSGHTHGGQIGNGIFMVLDTAGIVDIRGRSMKDDTIMYVTRGIGTSKDDNDYRLFSSPEIVVIN